MQVTVSVPGRFHLFNLAQQLLKRGGLQRLITSYPKFLTDRWGIPRQNVASPIILKEILERGYAKLPQSLRRIYNPQFAIAELFDRAAARRIVPTDIFVGMASDSLHSFRRAKELGAVLVLEGAGAHIDYQTAILREEYERFGVQSFSMAIAAEKVADKAREEYDLTDYFVAGSHFVGRTFIERGIPADKIFYVPYGVDLSSFKQLPKTDDVFRVVFAGGITLRKGVHYLMQAFAELKLPNSELLLVGVVADEMEQFFKKYAGSYRWIGKVPQAELHKHYSRSSVFAIASLEEGLAMVMPQAMACGLPVIATTNTGGEDIIRDGTDGFIIPIRNVEALKEKILYMYEHPEERERMGRSAKERVASGFTWDDYGDKIWSAYSEILARKKL